MNLTKNENTITQEDILNDMLLENGISLPEIYRYNKEHKSEIEGFQSVFGMRTEEDIRKCIALIGIIYPEKAKDIASYLLNDKGIENSTAFIAKKEDVIRYRIPLLTALVYNSSFFSIAWDLCNIILTEIVNNRVGTRETPTSEKDNVLENIIIFPQPFIINKVAASPKREPGMRQFGKDCRSGDINAVIRTLRDNAGVKFQIKCSFDKAPVYPLDVFLRTKADSKEHAISLDQSNSNNPLQIYSAIVKGINYAEGIELIGIKLKK
jgi:hypothetical protein